MKTNKEILFCRLYFFLTIALMLSAILGIKLSSYNSICIIALCAVWLIEGKFKSKFETLKKEPFVIICCVFYALYLLSIFISVDKTEALSIAQNHLPLLTLPIIFFSKKIFRKEAIIVIFKSFIWGVFIWMSVATVIALHTYFITHDINVLFYHSLLIPIRSNAIYAALLCILCVAIILAVPFEKKFRIGMFVFFSVWLMMLSSKMFLFIYVILILNYLYKHVTKSYKIILSSLIAITVLCIAITKNPISKRYEDLEKFKFSYLTDSSFNQKIYFDGLSLRLIYWRYSLETLQEQKSHVFGVGTGDARHFLDAKIKSYHMFTGDGTRKHGGYLRYSFDGLYLETLLALGFTGLIVLLIYLGTIGYFGKKYNADLLKNIFIISVFSCFSDSIILDSQCDLSLILALIYLAMQSSKATYDKNNFSKLMTEN